jgi:hypothetical protein
MILGLKFEFSSFLLIITVQFNPVEITIKENNNLHSESYNRILIFIR